VPYVGDPAGPAEHCAAQEGSDPVLQPPQSARPAGQRQRG
jgi:hypothetical protein